MTTTEMVTLIKDHIGDRQTGFIGSQTVDAACLASVNKALRVITKIPNFNPEEQQEEQNLSLVTSAYSYTMPTFTHGTLKSIISAVMKQTSETTGRSLIEIPISTFQTWFPIVDSSMTGRPVYFTFYHKTTVRFYPYPDSTYTVTFLANCFPAELALAVDLPYDEIWDEAIEAYATFDVFAKLQQTQDAVNWRKIYKDARIETLGALRKYPSRALDINLKTKNINLGREPGLDPFIRSVR